MVWPDSRLMMSTIKRLVEKANWIATNEIFEKFQAKDKVQMRNTWRSRRKPFGGATLRHNRSVGHVADPKLSTI